MCRASSRVNSWPPIAALAYPQSRREPAAAHCDPAPRSMRLVLLPSMAAENGVQPSSALRALCRRDAVTRSTKRDRIQQSCRSKNFHMSDIFISYASEDRPWAQMLAETLEDRGWSSFWDRAIPIGKTWRETIGRELNEARCVIVLWSKTSIDSRWVQEEADDAQRRGILVPVLIENVQPPIGFRSIQAADLVDWDRKEPTQAFRRLATDITALIGQPLSAKEEGKQAEAQLVERKAEEERKRAEIERAKAEAQRKADEEAEARLKAEKEEEKREGPSTQPSPQAPPSATPKLMEQRLEHVPSEKAKTVPIRTIAGIIAGSAIILGVIAIVAVWRPGSPVTPQPAPPVASQDASAMYTQGQRYYYGQGVPQDYAKAREWYEKAADKGNADAMANLGVFYE